MRGIRVAVGLVVTLLGVQAFGASVAVVCDACHNDRSWPDNALAQTAHGRVADVRTPMGGGGCSACHGDAGGHPANPSAVSPQVSFGPRRFTEVEQQNAACSGCHEGGGLALWDGGAHANEDVACAGCHVSHVARDPVLHAERQATVCYDCHANVRAESNLPSRHPIREAEILCRDCHNAHGSMTRGELVGVTLNDTCLRCHAELRGPYLFDHPPASEDCALCHRPHGAVHEPLLIARGPYLCQECHVANFHSSELFSGQGLPAAIPGRNLLLRNCMNCHPKVHGTNHPSGARLTR